MSTRIRRINRGRGHSYVDADGNKVPGVTTILGDGYPKPALINWAANTTAEYAVDHWDELTPEKPSARLNTLKKARYADRDTAANRGTQVHVLGEQLVVGKEVDVPDELAGHVESYVKFLDDWDVQPLHVEGVVLNETHMYAGTFDLIAEIPPLGQTLLLDIKTGRSGIWPETALQMAAYRYAEWCVIDGEEMPMPSVDGAAAIHVRADGYDLIPVDAGPATFRTFLYVRQIATYQTESGRAAIGDALTPPMEATA